MNLLPTIAPRSDQMNAEDLLAGPKTITITAVKGSDNPEQPVSIYYEGDEGKPYKPCKTCRRILVACWGGEGSEYVGKRLTLYCDPNVLFGGIKVGGIRISHVSHIDREKVIPLMVTRGKRSPFTVKPLRADVRQGPQTNHRQDERRPEQHQAEDRAQTDTRNDDFPGDAPMESDGGFDVIGWAQKLEADLPDYAAVDVLRLDWNEHKDELKAKNPELWRRVNLAIAKRAEEIGKGSAG